MGSCCVSGGQDQTDLADASSLSPKVNIEIQLVGFRFPPEEIMLAVGWYLRHGLSYRDVEELLAERGITVEHVSVYRWVQRVTPLLIDAARPCRHTPGDRGFIDERQSLWTMGLSVSGYRPGRPGH